MSLVTSAFFSWIKLLPPPKSAYFWSVFYNGVSIHRDGPLHSALTSLIYDPCNFNIIKLNHVHSFYIRKHWPEAQLFLNSKAYCDLVKVSFTNDVIMFWAIFVTPPPPCQLFSDNMPDIISCQFLLPPPFMVDVREHSQMTSSFLGQFWPRLPPC